MKHAVVLIALSLSVACSHAVNITSTPPGAEISVEGQKVGNAPTIYNETTAGSGEVKVTAKANGKEKQVKVQRNNFAMMPILAGAGAGAGGCLAFAAASSVCGLITGIGFIGLCAAPLFIPAGAGAAWFLYGNQMPDAVTVDMNDAAPAASGTAEVPPSNPSNPAASY